MNFASPRPPRAGRRRPPLVAFLLHFFRHRPGLPKPGWPSQRASSAAETNPLQRAYAHLALSRALLILACFALESADAATRTWTGGSASGANWNLRDNWSGAVVPTHGDTLVFPSGAARIFNTNNIPGLRLAMIQFTGAVGGYNLRGLGVTLTNGVTLIEGSDNTVSLESLTLGGNQTFHIPSDGGLTVVSDIALNGFNLSLAAIGDVTMRGAISGNGNVSKSGAGQLSLSGAENNTFNGSLTIASGTLAMNKFETISLVPLTQENRIAVPGNLILGNGSGTVVATAHFDHQISNGATVSVNENATLNLNGHADIVTHLELTGGAILTGDASLEVGGDVTANASPDTSVISGSLFLIGDTFFSVADGGAALDLDVRANVAGGALAHVTKTGTGTMRFGGTNTYMGMTYVNGGQLNAGNDDALGTQNGTTVVNSGAQLLLELGVDTLEEHLTLSGAGIGGTNGALRVSGSAEIKYNVSLDAPATIHVPNGSGLSIQGVVSGAGPLTKTGGGGLELAGDSANTFSGAMRVEQGLLLLSKLAGSAVQGDLVIGTGSTTATARHERSANLGGAVTVNAGGVYDLDGFNESIDSLTLNGGGDVQTGAGLLTVDGDIVVNAGLALSGSTSSIAGRLGVGSGTRNIIVAETGGIGGDSADLVISAQVSGSAAIIKSGTGDLSLAGANTFTGQLTVQDGELHVANNQALGSTAANTVLNGNSMLQVSGNLAVDENLFLNSVGKTNVGVWRNQGDNLWTGSIFLGQQTVVNVLANSELNVAGIVNGLSGLTKTGPGTLIYSGTSSNTYIGATIVNQGKLRLVRTGASGRAISGPLVIGDGVGGVAADVVEIDATDSQINRNSDVTVNASGLLDLKAGSLIQLIGSLSGTGRVQVEGSSLRVGYNDASTEFDGLLTGSGDFWKFGDGTLTLEGDNTLTGTTRANGGTLVINGNQPSSDVFVLGSGTLRGKGAVGDLTVFGRFAPGDPAGRLDAATINFEPGSTFVTDIDGPSSPFGYGGFTAVDGLDIAGASLEVSLGYPPVAGQVFLVGRNDSGNPTTGIFSGQPEGAVIVRNLIPLHLSYGGGVNNDITLTVGELALRLGTVRVTSGNGNGVIDPNECNELFVSIENPTAAGVIVLDAHLHSLDNQLIVTRSDAEYGTVPAGSTRTNQTAFQVRTSAGYTCGRLAHFQLIVSTLGHGRFAIPVTLSTGTPGDFITFQAQDTPRPIVDDTTVFMPLEVTNSFRVARARVTVHATHPSAGQLRFRLWSASGLRVELADHRGGAGNNFGTSCGARTIFSDSAPLSITAGFAPFAGAFRPEESLATLEATESSGTWYLEVTDDVPGSAGTVQCWSLELSPFECTDGGGGCDSCFASVSGELNGSSPTMAERLVRELPPSGCGDVQPCAGAVTYGAPPYRYGTHSFTNNGPATCVTVAINVPCANSSSGLVASAYLGDFNPGDLCANLLGGTGEDAVNGAGGFSFRVPAGGRFTVVVNEHNFDGSFQGCGNYSLDLYGLPCPEAQPRLHIANDVGPDAVRLHWSTAYPGFELQGRPSLNASILGKFTNVNATPVVIDGHYSVTNQHNRTNNGFFRLHKP